MQQGRPGARLPTPGLGHIAGPVAGIDRAFLAMQNPHRNRQRKTLDGASTYITWNEQFPFVRDARDAPAVEPHSAYVKEVSGDVRWRMGG